MESFVDIINAWPSVHDFAGDIGVPVLTVRSWRNRSAIPPGYWPPLIAAARRRNIPGINSTSLMFIYAQAKEDRRTARQQASGAPARSAGAHA